LRAGRWDDLLAGRWDAVLADLRAGRWDDLLAGRWDAVLADLRVGLWVVPWADSSGIRQNLGRAIKKLSAPSMRFDFSILCVCP